MNSRGQALVEFALAVAVLATLLVGMPVISRYHELQIATFEGARRLAFETAWLPPGATRPDTRAMREALFPSVVDSDQPVAERLSSSDSLSPTPGPAGQAMRVLLAPFKAVARLASGFDLRDTTLSREELTVAVSRPAGLPEPFAGIPIELHGSYTVLGDDWASAGPGQVARRAGSLVITHAAQSLHGLTAVATGLLAIIEPAFHQFCPGIIDPERVPADRLHFAVDHDTRFTTSWAPSC